MLQVHELVDCLGRDVFVLRGDVEGDEADALLQRFTGGGWAAHTPGAVLDLREVESIDAAGAAAICAIAEALRASGHPVELCNVQPRVAQALLI
jgi:anti-anti-sigma factor